MPLTADNAVHTNTGSFTGTSGTVALAAPGGVQDVTEAGNTVLLYMFTAGAGTLSPPSGWVRVGSSGFLYRRSNVPAGESSWSVSQSATQLTSWVVAEYSDIDINSPLIGSVGAAFVGSATSITATGGGTTGSGVPVEDQVTLGFCTAYIAGSTAPALSLNETTGAQYTTATTAVSGSGNDGTTAAAVMMAHEFPTQTVGSYTPNITYSISPAAAASLLVATFRAKGSALYPTLTHILGAQHGTSAGWTTGTAGFTYLASASAGVSITTSNPRHHTYAFRCNATTTACNFTDKSVTIAAGVYVGRLSFRLNATPGANLELGGTVSGVTFRWVQATGKLGAALPGGTEQVSAGTFAAGAYVTIDYRLDTSGTAWACEWSTTPDATKVVTAETTATATGVATTTFQPRWGWTTASTGDVNFSDLVGSSTAAAYPLGDYQVRATKIDGTQSAVITPGTPANWGLMTANGTIGAWNAATAAATLDDLPATVGASADGVVNVTAETTTVAFVCEPLTVAPTGTAKGARCCAVGWAASATASAIGARATLGTAFDSIFAPVADYNFDNSTTAPAWVCSGILGGGGSTRITQALLTVGATFHMGGVGGVTTDATPDVGFQAAYLEVAVKISPPLTIQRAPDGTAMATVYQDPDTSGYVGLQFAAPADRGMTYSYEFPAGTTIGPTALAAGASSAQIALDGSVVTSVPRVTCNLDPAP